MTKESQVVEYHTELGGVGMDEEFIAQLENKRILPLLLREDNIPFLEELITSESERLKRLQELKKKGNLDFGEYVKINQAKELLPVIQREVNDFLNIGNIPPINQIIFTEYSKYERFWRWIRPLTERSLDPSYGFGTMCLRQDRYTNFILTFGHEYTHHIQRYTVFKENKERKHSIFQEGHAIGIQRYLANKYFGKEGDMAFLYLITDTTVGLLKNTYIWLCKRLKYPINKELLGIKTCMEKIERKERFFFRKQPSPHALGNTLFTMYDSQYGNKIYTDIIHGNFKFINK